MVRGIAPAPSASSRYATQAHTVTNRRGIGSSIAAPSRTAPYAAATIAHGDMCSYCAADPYCGWRGAVAHPRDADLDTFRAPSVYWITGCSSRLDHRLLVST